MELKDVLFVSIYSIKWGRREELGAAFLASCLREFGFIVDFIQICEEDSFSNIRNLLKDSHYRLYGIACSHSLVPIKFLRRLGKCIKSVQPKCHITTGGYFATFNHSRLLKEWKELDSVIVGEGENTCLDLLHALSSKNQNISNIPGLKLRGEVLRDRPAIEHLDKLPFPSRDMLETTPYSIASLSTSRGCQAHCTFCNVPEWTRGIGKNWRGMSSDRVVAEVEYVVKNFGVRRFWIVDSSYEDPSPLEGEKRTREIAKKLIASDLVISYYIFMRAETISELFSEDTFKLLIKSGLRRIFVGLESGTDKVLKQLGKKSRVSDAFKALEKLRKLNISIRAGFIMFRPESDFSELRANLKFLKDTKLLSSTTDLMTFLELYSGSAELKKQKNNGTIIDSVWNQPEAYIYKDQKVKLLADTLKSLKNDPYLANTWESLHNSELLINGALTWSIMKEDKELEHLAMSSKHEIIEISELLADSNYLFFNELVDCHQGRHNSRKIDALNKEFIYCNHVNLSTAARQISKEIIRPFLAKYPEFIF